MTKSIDKMEIEGFRGISSALRIDLGGNLIILYGPNGSGKSSVLQAIEWVLTDRLPYMSGGDFRKEDAIVSLFSDSQGARVSLTARLGNAPMLVNRHKELGKSTTSRGRKAASVLTVETSSKVLVDNEASAALGDFLVLSPEDFSRSVFLHQDLIRDIVSMDDETRSETIGKLLGTSVVRQLEDALDVSTTKLVNDLDNSMNLEANYVRERAAGIEEKLRGKKQDLLGKGFKAEDLKLIVAKRQGQSLYLQIQNAFSYYEIGTPQKLTEPNEGLDAVSSFIETCEGIVDGLEGERFRAAQSAQTAKQGIDRAREKYSEAVASLKDFGSLEELERNIKEQESLIDMGDSTIRGLTEKSSRLNSAKNKIASLISDLDRYGSRLEEIESEGTLGELREKEAALVAEIPNLEAERDQAAREEQSAVDALRNDLDAFESRVTKAKRSVTSINESTAFMEDCDDVVKKTLVKYGEPIDLTQLTLASLNMDIEGLEAELRAAKAKKGDAFLLINDAKASRNTIRELGDELNQKLSGYNDLQDLQVQLEQKQNESHSLGARARQLSALNEIASLAAEYLTANQPDSCPVCAQPIQPTKVLARLDLDVISKASNEVKEAKEKELRLSREARALQTVLDQAKALRAKMEVHENNLEASIRKLKTLLGDETVNEAAFGEISSKLEETVHRLETLVARKSQEREIVQFVDHQQSLRRAESLKRDSEMAQLSKLVEEEINSSSDLDRLLRSLDTRLAGMEKAFTEKKRAVEKSVSEHIRRVETKHEELSKIRNRIKDVADIEQKTTKANEQLAGELKAASSLLGEETNLHYDFEAAIKAIEAQLKSARETQGKAFTLKTSLEDKAGAFRKAQQEAETAMRQLLEFVGPRGSQSGELLDLAKERSERLQGQIDKLSSTEELDKCKDSVRRLSAVVDYLKDEQEAELGSESIRTSEELITKLRAAKTAVEDLAGRIERIRRAAIEYEKEAVQSTMDSLQDKINGYYSLLLGHPIFKKIELQIEKEDPLLFSIRASGEDVSTYIPTRFSGAQMNVAAISIFFAMNDAMVSDLDLVLMDDPTQSMDDAHVTALAHLICEQSRKKKIIVATQEERFRQRLVDCQPDARVYEFSDWTEQGPRVGGP